ncbi:molybdopterin-dependent oxidoreductase [Thalassovita taeanensis]|nr:molybdopterin-dependent oxidoreductase [Thalassovita taeanensis]
MVKLWTILACFTALLAWSGGAGATDRQAEPCPTALDVVLQVTFEDGSARAARALTMADLMALPRSGFFTTTIWSEGTQHFQGVWLKDLLGALDVTEGVLTLSALNEYLIDIPVAEVDESDALIAYERNGAPMSARDKGPLWMVFPYDRDLRFQTETVFALSVWQMDRIEVGR